MKNHKHLYEPDSALMYSVELYHRMISLELVWELEYDFLSGEFLVDVAESFQFVFNISLHGFVEVDLEIRNEIHVQNL